MILSRLSPDDVACLRQAWLHLHGLVTLDGFHIPGRYPVKITFRSDDLGGVPGLWTAIHTALSGKYASMLVRGGANNSTESGDTPTGTIQHATDAAENWVLMKDGSIIARTRIENVVKRTSNENFRRGFYTSGILIMTSSSVQLIPCRQRPNILP